MILLNPTSLDLVTGTGPSEKIIQTASTAGLTPLYETLTPGRYSFTVFRANDRQTPLKTFDVNLLDRSYYTIYVQQFPNGQLTTELIDDTPDPTKPPINRLTIRQTSYISHGVLAAAAGQQTKPLEPGGTEILAGLPDGVMTVSARTQTPKGPKYWSGEADFRVSHHATLFVYSDNYGRLRLRCIADGPSPVEEAEAAAAAKASQTVQ